MRTTGQPNGLPGTQALEKLVNGLAAIALLGCGAALVIGAAQWGLGQRANNYSQAADGKTKMLYGIGGAFVVGAASALINFFQTPTYVRGSGSVPLDHLLRHLPSA